MLSISIKKKELGTTTFGRIREVEFVSFLPWNTLTALNFILLVRLLWKNLQGHPKDRGKQNETQGRVFFKKRSMM